MPTYTPYSRQLPASEDEVADRIEETFRRKFTYPGYTMSNPVYVGGPTLLPLDLFGVVSKLAPPPEKKS